MKTLKVGFVGVGSISGIYLENISKVFKEVEVIGVCDLIRERAEKAVKKYNLPKLYNDMYELFADPEVDIVLNITRPLEHYEVTKAALHAGKHVYTEKPLAASFELGKELVALAKEKGLMLGGAPDTFMGAGIQTCRKLIEEGAIGDIIGGAGFVIGHGPEDWHPDPEFIYKKGVGPMFDMGPYYLTALVNMIGNVESVYAMTNITFPERMITSQPHNGDIIKVEVPTMYCGNMRFVNGAIGTMYATYDVYYPNQARLEVYGTKGTLYAPDPNFFNGPVKIYRPGEGVKEMPLEFGYSENSRSLGIADMAKAIMTGRDMRASCDQMLHILEIADGFNTSGRENRAVSIESRFEKASLMDPALEVGVL